VHDGAPEVVGELSGDEVPVPGRCWSLGEVENLYPVSHAQSKTPTTITKRKILAWLTAGVPDRRVSPS
jgi:hypothetical protein